MGIMAQDGGIVPAIYGGAVETLLTMLIEENEKKGLCDLIIFSTYDKQAAMYSSKYKFTKNIFIHSRLHKKSFKFLDIGNSSKSIFCKKYPSLNNLSND